MKLVYQPTLHNLPYAYVEIEDEDENGIAVYQRYQLTLPRRTTLKRALANINDVLDAFDNDPKSALPVLKERLEDKAS